MFALANDKEVRVGIWESPGSYLPGLCYKNSGADYIHIFVGLQ